MYRIALIVLLPMLLAATVPAHVALSALPARSAPPGVLAIALRQSELPSGYKFAPKLSLYVPPGKLNSDTVPYGLSVRRLKAAGFRGAYSQDFASPGGADQYGEFWQYLAFAHVPGAHRVYLDWTRAQKPPFTALLGQSKAGDECKLYSVPSLSPRMRALICRAGPFVILGHFNNAAALQKLMSRVVSRAHHIRP